MPKSPRKIGSVRKRGSPTSEFKYKEASLQGWVEEVKRVVWEDVKRRSTSQMWHHMVGNASALAEALRREQPGLALDALADIFLGTSVFMFRLHVSSRFCFRIDPNTTFDDVIWHKYPGVCPACGLRICGCSSLGIDRMDSAGRERLKKKISGKMEKYRLQVDRKPKTLDQWVDMNRKIYRGRYEDATLIQVGLHFVEEVGEVARELEKGYGFAPTVQSTETERIRIGLRDELADIFSWTTAVFLKLTPSIEAIQTFLEGYYGKRLPDGRILLSDVIWRRWQTVKVYPYYGAS